MCVTAELDPAHLVPPTCTQLSSGPFAGTLSLICPPTGAQRTHAPWRAGLRKGSCRVCESPTVENTSKGPFLRPWLPIPPRRPEACSCISQRETVLMAVASVVRLVSKVQVSRPPRGTSIHGNSLNRDNKGAPAPPPGVSEQEAEGEGRFPYKRAAGETQRPDLLIGAF